VLSDHNEEAEQILIKIREDRKEKEQTLSNRIRDLKWKLEKRDSEAKNYILRIENLESTIKDKQQIINQNSELLSNEKQKNKEAY